MISNLRPYPAMKDSGAGWLGQVPAHWTMERLKSSMDNIVEHTTDRCSTDLIRNEAVFQTVRNGLLLLIAGIVVVIVAFATADPNV